MRNRPDNLPDNRPGNHPGNHIAIIIACIPFVLLNAALLILAHRQRGPVALFTPILIAPLTNFALAAFALLFSAAVARRSGSAGSYILSLAFFAFAAILIDWAIISFMDLQLTE